MQESWLISFICDADARRWCNRLFCTTCGAREFRSELAHRTLLRLESPPWRTPYNRHFDLALSKARNQFLLADFSRGAYERAVEHLAEELSKIYYAELNTLCDPHYAEWSIGMILYEIGVRPDQPLIFQSETAWKILEGSEVGGYASEWRKSITDRANRLETEERRAATRREALKKQRLEAACERRSKIRIDFLSELSKLSLLERLNRLAHDEHRPVEWYPTCIAGSVTESVIEQVPEKLRLALVCKLRGRHRGPWGTFKKRLCRVHP